MKIFTLNGGSAAERTAMAQKIATELERRHRSTTLWLAADTAEQKAAAPQPAKTISGNSITFGNKMTLEDFLPYIHEDFLILDQPMDMLPNLSLDKSENDLTFAKAANFRDDFPALVDFVEAHAPERMPFIFGNPCCRGCSHGSCHGLLAAIIKGTADISECTVTTPNVRAVINGNELTLVEFGQNIIRHTNQGLLSTLNGYAENAHIEIEIFPQNEKADNKK